MAAAAISLAACGDEEGEVEVTTIHTTVEAETLPIPEGAGAAGGMPLAIAGFWTGELSQRGLEPFEVAVRIRPDGPTRVAYTGIDCGGSWTFRLAGESKPPTYVIDEVIDEGKSKECKGTGTVTLKPHSKRPPYLKLSYQFDGGGVTSRGVLDRVNQAKVEAVFERVGVASPVLPGEPEQPEQPSQAPLPPPEPPD